MNSTLDSDGCLRPLVRRSQALAVSRNLATPADHVKHAGCALEHFLKISPDNANSEPAHSI